MNIFEELSKILGLYITRDTVDREVKIIDSTGRLTQRKLLEILIMICKKLDEERPSSSIQSTKKGV